jgi:excisionase family DNA binding protein
MFMTPNYYTTRKASEMLRVSQQRILQMIYSNQMYAERMGGIWLIPAVELKAKMGERAMIAGKDGRYVSPY